MSAFLTLLGIYFIWFSLRVGPFNYKNQNDPGFRDLEEGGSKHRQIYWGAMPLFAIGAGVILAAMLYGN